jgi:4-hydroxy-3-polyprenylbenzoate decarboxylase
LVDTSTHTQIMAYRSLEHCLLDLEKQGQLVRVKEEVDPYLEMAAIHLRVHAAGGPALLFERVKGSRFRAASNLFGTLDRSRFLFRDTIAQVEHLIQLKNNPALAFKHPLKSLKTLFAAVHALPLRARFSHPVQYQSVRISDLPLIHHWPMDGGAFVTLPQVYTEDPDRPGVMNSNLGMYRIQLSGNDYNQDQEIGLHYQLHRGIGVHQTKANRLGKPLRVSVFVGGPPAHTLAAVMPLPEGLSEVQFAGMLAGRHFRYSYQNGCCISEDADFVIIGEVMPGENKPEGPFGDHLGYYSLKHDFPLMRVTNVYARKNAIWPFTVVGRPPQEDTAFGDLIHSITGDALQHEVPGLLELNAVDAAGVHPLLIAIGSERYTPYNPTQQPAELLTIANRMLGTGQLSLAKFLFITGGEDKRLNTHDIEYYFRYLFERIDLRRDLHFYTKTTIDTLDYSGESLNSGSKVVVAAYGNPKRTLATEIPTYLKDLPDAEARLIFPGVVALKTKPYTDAAATKSEVDRIESHWRNTHQPISSEETLKSEIVWIVWCDDAVFTAANMRNFLWVAFTRSNPSHDLHGLGAVVENKHWGCTGPVLLDARIKPHHAPAMTPDPTVERNIDRLFQPGGSLHGIES